MFLSKLPTPFQLTLFSLVFFPETEIYRKAKKEGLVKDDLNDIYRKHYQAPKKTFLNEVFFLLNEYVVVGIGISPIIMFLLTHKRTRQLHLHWHLFKVIKLLYPFFRYIGRSTRLSTRLYKVGNIIKFREGISSYRTHTLSNFNLSEFHSSGPSN